MTTGSEVMFAHRLDSSLTQGQCRKALKKRVVSRLGAVIGIVVIVVSCQRAVFDETMIVGTWDQHLMDATNRLKFEANHKVTVLMEYDGNFKPFALGDWRVEA